MVVLGKEKIDNVNVNSLEYTVRVNQGTVDGKTYDPNEIVKTGKLSTVNPNMGSVYNYNLG